MGSAYGDVIHAGGGFQRVDGGFGNDVILANGSDAEISGGMRLADIESLAAAYNLDVEDLLDLPDNDIIIDDGAAPSRFVFSEHGGRDVLLTDFEWDTELFFEGLNLSDLTMTVAGEDIYGNGTSLSISGIVFEVDGASASLVVGYLGGVWAYTVEGTSDYNLASDSNIFFNFENGSRIDLGDIIDARSDEKFWSIFHAGPGEKYEGTETVSSTDSRIPEYEVQAYLDGIYFSAFDSDPSLGGLPASQQQRSAPTFVSIIGTSGQDLIGGTKSDDLIDAGAGDDLIFGDEGDDEINGGDGFDTVVYIGSIADYDVVTILDGEDRVIGFASVTDEQHPRGARPIRDRGQRLRPTDQVLRPAAGRFTRSSSCTLRRGAVVAAGWPPGRPRHFIAARHAAPPSCCARCSGGSSCSAGTRAG